MRARRACMRWILPAAAAALCVVTPVSRVLAYPVEPDFGATAEYMSPVAEADRYTLVLDAAADSLAALGPAAPRAWTREDVQSLAGRIRDRLLARGELGSGVRVTFVGVVGLPAAGPADADSGMAPALGTASIQVARRPAPARIEFVVHGGEDVVPDAERLCSRTCGSTGEPARIRAGLEALRAAAEARGRYAAEARLDSVVLLDQGTARLHVSLRPGPPIALDTLELTGSSVRSSVAGSISGLKRGRLLTPAALEEAHTRLMACGLFASVGDLAVIPADEPGHARVRAPVMEQRLSRFEGALGMQRGGGLSGLADLAIGNIGGTGRSAAVHWAGLGDGRSDYAARYREPSLFGKPLDASLSLEAQVLDSVYTQTRWSLELSGRPLTPARASASLRRSGSTYTGLGRGTSATWSLLGSLEWRAFREPWNPTRGLALALTGEAGRRSDAYPGYEPARRGLYRGSFLIEGAQPTGRSRALYGAVRGARVSLGEGSFPAEELLFLGGSEGLRGHRDRAFAGDRTFQATLEHRWITDPRAGRAYLFVDAARHDLGSSVEAGTARGVYGLSLARTVLSPGWEFGYGAGLRSPTRAGIFGIELGQKPGASLRELKLHLHYTADW